MHHAMGLEKKQMPVSCWNRNLCAQAVGSKQLTASRIKKRAPLNPGCFASVQAQGTSFNKRPEKAIET